MVLFVHYKGGFHVLLNTGLVTEYPKGGRTSLGLLKFTTRCHHCTQNLAFIQEYIYLKLWYLIGYACIVNKIYASITY